MNFNYPDGATPLDADEAGGLIPKHITLQSELNSWETANILEGERWVAQQKKRDLIDELFVRDLHRKMFGQTWGWAGTFRRSNKKVSVSTGCKFQRGLKIGLITLAISLSIPFMRPTNWRRAYITN